MTNVLMVGVDVSANNHSLAAQIDWSAVKSSGNSLAFIRTSEGIGYNVQGLLTNSVDPWWKYDSVYAAQAGFVVGGYHVLHPNLDIQAQAELFTSTAGTALGLRAVDLEPWVTNYGSAAEIMSAVNEFKALCESAFKRPLMIYCDDSLAQWLGVQPEWEASYNPSPTGSPLLWQYSDTGTVSGIPGNVDQDKWLGTLLQLHTYTGEIVPNTNNPDNPSNAAPVAIVGTPSGAGYYIFCADGGVFTYGDAVFYGSAGAIKLNKPIVTAAMTPTGKGYVLVASDGGVFTYGDAQFEGSTGDLTLVAPIIGAAFTPSGKGYWLVASDGNVYPFGDAAYHGRISYGG